MPKKHKKKIGIKFFILLLILAVAFVVFWSSSALLFFGMLPSFAFWLIDKSIQKSKTLTIAAMNFVGCFPYLVDIWNAANPFEKSMQLLTDPLTIIVIYMIAMMGYVINYITVTIVSSHVYDKTKLRIKSIEKEKIELEKRWGKKVNGDTPLDEKGFPVDGLSVKANETAPS